MNYSRNKELIKKARVLRSNMTLAEILLWSRLRSKQVDGYKFRRQQPIFDYIADFYCHELKLIIEVDGEVYSFTEQVEHDKKRDKILKINGFHVYRLSNYEVETNLDLSIDKLKLFISSLLSPSMGTIEGFPNEK
jgi:very-short-patch-repair endonuclease